MDFQLTEEEKMLQASARAFLEREVAPAAQERDGRGPLTREETIRYIKKLMPFGYYNGWLPAEYGGADLSYKTAGVLTEELSRAWAGLAGVVWMAGGSGGVLGVADARRSEMMERVRAGEAIGAGAISEPNVGSNASSIETTAALDGDDWVLNGTKQWISNGPVCDHVYVAAQTDRAAGRAGIRWILVEKGVSPYEVTRTNHLLGLRAWPNGELNFQDCRVPRQNLRSPAEIRPEAMRRVWRFEVPRSTLAIMSVGIAQAAIDASISYARERVQWGRPIGSFQLVQEMIVDMIMETEAARLLAYQAMDLLDRDEDCTWQAAAAKAFATEMAIRVTSKAIEVHGAVGLSDDLPLERYFRDARAMTIPDGTTEIQKLIIGRNRIGISAFK
ncbi:MAG: acyl-CoA dehydrogenase family protein [Dehalococcoidia bacterium]|nr:acyl-CoA dehydrogenase family protein [Dehalococcoidia bacterium]